MRKQGWRLVVLAACAAALVTAGGLRAQEDAPKPGGSPLDRKALDKHVYDTLREVINYGADLYNGGDPPGCYRLYEGALMALKPLLDHRPALQKAITDGIATARSRPVMADRAFALRGVIDKIRDDCNPNPKKPPVAESLWDRLGGQAAVTAVVEDFVGVAAGDKRVNFFRGKPVPPAEKVAAFKKSLVNFIHDATKGKDDKTTYYKGPDMKTAHKGMMITDKEFDALADDLIKTLKKFKVPEKEINELVGIVGSTRKDIVEKKGGDGGGDGGSEKTMSLWDRLGGEPAVKKVVEDVFKEAAADKRINFFRGKPATEDKIAQVKKGLVDFVHDATKGPDDKTKYYKGPDMKTAHEGMGITDKEFDALAEDLAKVLKANKVKEADAKALMTIVGSTRPQIVEKKKPDKPTDK